MSLQTPESAEASDGIACQSEGNALLLLFKRSVGEPADRCTIERLAVVVREAADAGSGKCTCLRGALAQSSVGDSVMPCPRRARKPYWSDASAVRPSAVRTLRRRPGAAVGSRAAGP